jgi:hypothetical protein
MKIKAYYDGLPIYESNFNKYSYSPEGYYYGLVPECVEWARRWYIHHYHITFPEVKHAYELLHLTHAYDIDTHKKYKWLFPSTPEVGDLLVWSPSSRYPDGHVAIVLEINGTMKIVEQNGPTKNGVRFIKKTSQPLMRVKLK